MEKERVGRGAGIDCPILLWKGIGQGRDRKGKGFAESISNCFLRPCTCIVKEYQIAISKILSQ